MDRRALVVMMIVAVGLVVGVAVYVAGVQPQRLAVVGQFELGRLLRLAHGATMLGACQRSDQGT